MRFSRGTRLFLCSNAIFASVVYRCYIYPYKGELELDNMQIVLNDYEGNPQGFSGIGGNLWCVQ